MTVRLRPWLAGLALCLLPSAAHAQHFMNQCSQQPVPIPTGCSPAETVTDAGNDQPKIAVLSQHAVEVIELSAADLGIEHCVGSDYVPLRIEVRKLQDADDVAAAPAGAEEAVAAMPVEKKIGPEAVCPMIATIESWPIEIPDFTRSRRVTPPQAIAAKQPSERQADAILAGSAEAIVPSLVAAIEQLASEEPLDVAATEPPLKQPQPPTEATTAKQNHDATAGDEAVASKDADAASAADLAAVPFNDAPIICTLRAPEEYLPYDLTPTDSLRWQLFADGIARPERVVPRSVARETEPAPAEEESADVAADLFVCPWMHLVGEDEEPFASVVAPEAAESSAPEVVATEQPVELARPPHVTETTPAFSVACAIDELVWQAGEALRPQGWLRARLAPESIGRQLARVVTRGQQQAAGWVQVIASRLPVAPPAPAGGALAVKPDAAEPDAAEPAEAPEAAAEIAGAAEPEAFFSLLDESHPTEPAETIAVEPVEEEPYFFSLFDAEDAVMEPAGPQEIAVPALVGPVLPQPAPEPEVDYDAELERVLEFVRALTDPFRRRIANGGQETDRIAR